MAGTRSDASGGSSHVGHETRAGDRGSASGVNLAHSRAIGQDDPIEGSRMGREQHKRTGYPGSGEPGDGEGTNASQRREAGER